MSADNHANYTKIGLAVVAGVLAIVATLVYLAGAGDARDELLLETYYDNPVSGLAVGSVVNFRGVKVGEVKKIGFIGSEYPDAAMADHAKIYILMSIRMNLAGVTETADQDEMRKGSGIDPAIHATVTSSGITGLSRIELNYSHSEVPHKALSWRPANVFIHPSASLFDNFSTAATKVMNQINRMNFEGVWSNVQSVAESVSSLSRNADRMLREQRKGVESIVRNVDELSASLRDLSGRLRDNPSLLLRENDPEPLPETRFR